MNPHVPITQLDHQLTAIVFHLYPLLQTSLLLHRPVCVIREQVTSVPEPTSLTLGSSERCVEGQSLSTCPRDFSVVDSR